MKSENNSSTSNISRSPLKELLNNIKDVNTSDNNITTNGFDNNQSCHEHNGTTSTTTTTVPSVSSSSPTKSKLSISINNNDNSSVIENLENIEITKQNLRDEITKLKNEADLWNIIDEHGGSGAGVKVRIAKTRAAYLQLNNIWNSKQLPANQHQGQNFRSKYQDNSTVWGGNLENYESHHPEDTSVYLQLSTQKILRIR
ncbi:unnamed protein product [Schistosoma mattheei]|uniref:Uncharacterized protein n=1 Tax=Schistosoma mattheei TaxID=31246 RepID=A0A183Q173_9TREM|nr:unnamed protein product [Schistosoma mattheei]